MSGFVFAGSLSAGACLVPYLRVQPTNKFSTQICLFWVGKRKHHGNLAYQLCFFTKLPCACQAASSSLLNWLWVMKHPRPFDSPNGDHQQALKKGGPYEFKRGHHFKNLVVIWCSKLWERSRSFKFRLPSSLSLNLKETWKIWPSDVGKHQTSEPIRSISEFPGTFIKIKCHATNYDCFLSIMCFVFSRIWSHISRLSFNFSKGKRRGVSVPFHRFPVGTIGVFSNLWQWNLISFFRGLMWLCVVAQIASVYTAFESIYWMYMCAFLVYQAICWGRVPKQWWTKKRINHFKDANHN